MAEEATQVEIDTRCARFLEYIKKNTTGAIKVCSSSPPENYEHFQAYSVNVGTDQIGYLLEGKKKNLVMYLGKVPGASAKAIRENCGKTSTIVNPQTQPIRMEYYPKLTYEISVKDAQGKSKLERKVGARCDGWSNIPFP